MKIISKLSLLGIIIAPNNIYAQENSNTLSLESFFQGETHAIGKFTAINGLSRNFEVKLNGKFENQILELREDFIFEDGQKDTKTWKFKKISPQNYKGTREDVIGETEVEIIGNVAKFTYLVYLDGNAKKMKVRFRDKMTLVAPNKLINEATIYKFFIPIAKTRVEFTR